MNRPESRIRSSVASLYWFICLISIVACHVMRRLRFSSPSENARVRFSLTPKFASWKRSPWNGSFAMISSMWSRSASADSVLYRRSVSPGELQKVHGSGQPKELW
jgi:hypothetical protein